MEIKANESAYVKTVEQGGKIRSSITNKLNRKLFFRLFGLFLSLNIIICILAGFALAFYSEGKIAGAIEMLPHHELPVADNWMGLTGMNVRVLSEPTASSPVRWSLQRRLSFEPEYMYRGFRAEQGGFNNTIRSISYVVNVGYGGGLYEVEVHIGTFLLYFIYALFILMGFEVLTLLSRTIEDRKMIRKTLNPIKELARAAQSLNEVNRQFDREKVLQLPGILDGIDAGRLDTRIQIDELQDELKNVAIAINDMLDRINESYAAQARFVSDASHELRTPIAVIQGYANLLDRWGTEDEKALEESISAIKDEAENMKDLVEQLLFLARGDSNRINMVAENVSLLELVDDVVTESRIIDDRHEFKVTCENVSVSADRGLLKQAIRILVDNAIKYTDKNGEITISATADGSFVRISVSDSGIGINPEILPNVFDRFVRADESRTRATGGAGLGLSIAQWIVSRHNGHLEVLSREGIGTRITLVLPALTPQSIEKLPEAI